MRHLDSIVEMLGGLGPRLEHELVQNSHLVNLSPASFAARQRGGEKGAGGEVSEQVKYAQGAGEQGGCFEPVRVRPRAQAAQHLHDTIQVTQSCSNAMSMCTCQKGHRARVCSPSPALAA